VILVNTRRGTFRGAALQDSIINWLAQTKKAPYELSSKTASVTPQGAPAAETKQPSSVLKDKELSSGDYYIQIASVTKRPDSHYLSKLEKAGLRYTVVHEERYKVLIGGYPSRESAQNALPKIRQKFNKGAFIVAR